MGWYAQILYDKKCFKKTGEYQFHLHVKLRLQALGCEKTQN
jgi:hypothetical protein